MTPEQLKASILQYAIQGKLVEQRAEEGTATALYHDIQQEKKQLIASGKLKKEKSLSKVDDNEILFDIPNNWIWTRIGDIFAITMGQSPVGKSVSKSSDGMEFHQGKIFFGEDYIHESDQTTSQPSKIAEANSVLLCVRAPVGTVNITDRELCIGRGLCSIKPLAGMTDKFTLYALRCLKNEFIRQATGTTFVAITGEVVKNQVIPLPPLEEQHRIVAKIEELLPFVNRYAASYEKLEKFNARFPEKIKKSILQYAIQGKLVEQRAEEGNAENLYQKIQEEKQKLIKEGKIKKNKTLPQIDENELYFDIPEAWKWVRLNDIVYNHGQKTPENTFSYIDIGSIDNIHQKLNTEEKLIKADKAPSRARKIVKFGDIIYSTVRPYLHNTCIIDKEFKAEPIASTGFAVLACHKGVYNKYLFYYLLSPAFDTYANASENSKGVAYPAINDDKLYRAVVPIPPYEEQKRIVHEIEEMLPYCDRLIK